MKLLRAGEMAWDWNTDLVLAGMSTGRNADQWFVVLLTMNNYSGSPVLYEYLNTSLNNY